MIEEKQPYLFSSDDLAQLIEVTPSIRTKLSIFSSIGPRLIDPHARLAYFTGLFRFSEEKAIVEEILRDRAQTLSASLFAKIEPNSPSFRAIAGRGLYAGRGGRRGRGERDAIRRASTFEATTDSTPIEVKEQKGSNRWSMPSYATGTDNRGII